MARTEYDDRARAISLAALLVALAGALPALAAPGEVCYVAELPAAIVLPDGSTHDGGTLKFCTRSFTPVSALHRTYVDGRLAGMFLSRAGTSEAIEERRPYFLFRREGDEALVLEGFARPDGDRFVTYALGGTRVSSHWQLARELGEARDDTGWILVAAVGP